MHVLTWLFNLSSILKKAEEAMFYFQTCDFNRIRVSETGEVKASYDVI